MEEQIKTAILDELQRQAETNAEFEVRRENDCLFVHGQLDVDAIVMVVVGSVAGGP